MSPIDDQFSVEKSGAVWGRVFFKLSEEEFFPSDGWTDLVVAFESGWTNVLLELASGDSVGGRATFFDGPFSIRLAIIKPGTVDLIFLRGEDVRCSTSASLSGLLEGAVSAAEKVLIACKSRRWTNADTERLNLLSRRAREYLRRSGVNRS
jgi:hypothetical protein